MLFVSFILVVISGLGFIVVLYSYYLDTVEVSRSPRLAVASTFAEQEVVDCIYESDKVTLDFPSEIS